MKKILYFTVFGIVMVAGLAGTIYFSIQPRSVPKIDYSEFTTPARIGEAIALGLRFDFQQSPILILGVLPGHEEEMIAYKSLLDHLTEPGFHYDVVVVEPQLPYREMFGATQELSFRDDFARFEEGARKAIADGKRIAFVTASTFASRLVRGNQANQLAADGIPAITFAAAPFPRSRVEEKSFEVECLASNDETGMGSFGCAILNKARQVYRKKKDPAKYSATLDLVGAMDYLFLMNSPQIPPNAPQAATK